MYIRTAPNTLYIEVENEELDYFMDNLGIDTYNIHSVSDLEPEEITSLLQSVCQELFAEHQDELTDGILDMLVSFSGVPMSVEVTTTNDGVTFKMSPKQTLNAEEYGNIEKLKKQGKLMVAPQEGIFPMDDASFFEKYNNPNISDAERIIFNLLSDFMHSLGTTCPTKKELNEKIDNYIEEKEYLHEDYIDTIIRKCLKDYALNSPETTLETLTNWLRNSNIFYCYLVREYLMDLRRAKSVKKYDVQGISDEKIDAFEQKVKNIYENLELEYFYKIKSLNDGLKAMPLVSEGCIIKIKATYYLVTKGYNPVFIDFGTKVDTICYTEDSIICRIKDGTFNVEQNKK